MEALVLLGCLALPVMAFGLVATLTHWIMAPLVRVARQTPSPTRFVLVDLIALLVYVQVAMGIVAAALRSSGSLTHPGALVYAALAAGIFWYAPLHVLSQTGIEPPLRRLTAQLVLFPGAVLVVIALPTLAWGIMTTFWELHKPAEVVRFAGFGLAFCVIVLAAWMLRRLAGWTVARG
jgi:hypothetical protein